MKFSGKMWFIIILKATNKLHPLSNNKLHPRSRRYILEKPQGGMGGSQIYPPTSLLRVKLCLIRINTWFLWDP